MHARLALPVDMLFAFVGTGGSLSVLTLKLLRAERKFSVLQLPSDLETGFEDQGDNLPA